MGDELIAEAKELDVLLRGHALGRPLVGVGLLQQWRQPSDASGQGSRTPGGGYCVP